MKRLLTLLFSRLFLFLFFQALMALWLSSWEGSVKYWTLSATLTNGISILLLCVLLKQEHSTYRSLFRFQKAKWKIDMLWLLGFLVVSVPLAIAPSLTISTLLWGNTEYYHQVLFQPLDRRLVYFLIVAYPVSTALAELTTYFGYVMPRLKVHLKSDAWIIALPVMAFSLQHCTLPLVPEARFIFFRGVMYLLFSLVYGFAIFKRPSLLPWLALLQMIIYLLPTWMLLGMSQ